MEQIKGEELKETGWDEAIIYNVLQHTESPEKVIAQARKAVNVIRLFEWIDRPATDGHLHILTEAQLNQWLGGEGKVENFTGQNGCYGKAYYGVFPTKRG